MQKCRNRPDINFGAIYENVVAQELRAHGFKGYYFKNRKLGELDFVMASQRPLFFTKATLPLKVPCSIAPPTWSHACCPLRPK
ncbi:MAG: DUF4143 domain-containing protein [Christensenella sp.]